MVAVTVITPSLPARGRMLERARASVADQTLLPDSHLIAVDFAGVGPARLRNQLAANIDTEYLAFLDDDDHLDPQHLELLVNHAKTTGADVVYPDVRFEGPPLPKAHLPVPFNRKRLRDRGFIPITFVMRTATFNAARGFSENARYEDWELLNKIADGGGKFEFVPEVTWTYCTAHPDRRTNL